MKKTLLPLGVAAAVACTTVTPAYAQEVPDAPVAEQESSSGSSAGDEGQEGDAGSSLSTGAIVGISLGVLALVGAGSYFAVSQGLIDVPGLELPQVPGLGELGALAGAAGLAIPALSAGKQEKNASCQPGAFDAIVPGWPAPTGTTVQYCDGKWAVAGAKQTDWIVAFRANGDKWAVVKPDGETNTGFKCYNTATLRGQGAPKQFTDKLQTC
ncbi:hypothetical protein [Corynebacterium sp. HMSC074A01]|uniref:hypothetical protein n=1 Tax=Corynebacterium sp. HMSC074A01 TaxID=1715030 RepID=UPI0008A158B7|nr:hypothetical protein [Corynebacterium sp. HMSC074A01]OHF36134.1 hypothetical protein HMPREF2550_09710 [Corynebacterium sp. HMSC074A01]